MFYTKLLNRALLIALATTPMLASVILTKDASLVALADTATEQKTFPIPENVPTGTKLQLEGSNSTSVVSETIKAEFEKKFPGTEVTINISGDEKAIQNLLDDKVELVALGRQLTQAEKDQGLQEVAIGKQKIAIVIGASNPFDKNINLQQFRDIVQGKITNWSEVGGPDKPIKLISLPDSSETKQAIKSYEVFGGNFESAPSVEKLSEDSLSAVTQALGDDGIGYIIANQVSENKDVKIVPMSQTSPTDSRYPFSQPMVYVFKGTPTPAKEAFLGLATSQAVQEILQKLEPVEEVPQAAPVATPSPTPETVQPPVEPSKAPPAPEGGFPWWLLLLIPLLGLPLLFWYLNKNKNQESASSESEPTPPTQPPTPLTPAQEPPVVIPAVGVVKEAVTLPVLESNGLVNPLQQVTIPKDSHWAAAEVVELPVLDSNGIVNPLTEAKLTTLEPTELPVLREVEEDNIPRDTNFPVVGVLAGGAALVAGGALLHEPEIPESTTTESGGIAQVANSVENAEVIYLAEKNDNETERRIELEIIKELHKRSPNLAIGLDKFERSFQPVLNQYLAKEITESELSQQQDDAQRATWRDYAPIFKLALDDQIPILALKAPQEVTDAHLKNETIAQEISQFITANPGHRLVVITDANKVSDDYGIPGQVATQMSGIRVVEQTRILLPLDGTENIQEATTRVFPDAPAAKIDLSSRTLETPSIADIESLEVRENLPEEPDSEENNLVTETDSGNFALAGLGGLGVLGTAAALSNLIPQPTEEQNPVAENIDLNHFQQTPTLETEDLISEETPATSDFTLGNFEEITDPQSPDLNLEEIDSQDSDFTLGTFEDTTDLEGTEENLPDPIQEELDLPTIDESLTGGELPEVTNWDLLGVYDTENPDISPMGEEELNLEGDFGQEFELPTGELLPIGEEELNLDTNFEPNFELPNAELAQFPEGEINLDMDLGQDFELPTGELPATGEEELNLDTNFEPDFELPTGELPATGEEELNLDTNFEPDFELPTGELPATGEEELNLDTNFESDFELANADLAQFPEGELNLDMDLGQDFELPTGELPATGEEELNLDTNFEPDFELPNAELAQFPEGEINLDMDLGQDFELPTGELPATGEEELNLDTNFESDFELANADLAQFPEGELNLDMDLGQDFELPTGELPATGEEELNLDTNFESDFELANAGLAQFPEEELNLDMDLGQDFELPTEELPATGEEELNLDTNFEPDFELGNAGLAQFPEEEINLDMDLGQDFELPTGELPATGEEELNLDTNFEPDFELGNADLAQFPEEEINLDMDLGQDFELPTGELPATGEEELNLDTNFEPDFELGNADLAQFSEGELNLDTNFLDDFQLSTATEDIDTSLTDFNENDLGFDSKLTEDFNLLEFTDGDSEFSFTEEINQEQGFELTPEEILTGGAALAGAATISALSEPREHSSDSGIEQVVKELEAANVVYLGETADTPKEHQAELQIIRELFEKNGRIAIGIDRFARNFQPILNAYLASEITEEDLQHQLLTQYDDRRGFPWTDYKEIFQFAKENSIPLLALNAPREVIIKIEQQGLNALSEDESKWVPSYLSDVFVIAPDNSNYREFLHSIYSETHINGFSDEDFEKYFSGQVVQTETMAAAASEFIQANSGCLLVVIADNQHVVYGYGIPSRIESRLSSEGNITHRIVLLNPSKKMQNEGEGKVANYFLTTN